MTTLRQIVSDPKALVARMRVGKVEPSEMRRAVLAIENSANSAESTLGLDVEELQQRILDLCSAHAFGELSRRELREGCKVILHPPQPIAVQSEVLHGLFAEVERNHRRGAFFAAIDAYLDGFVEDDDTVVSVANKLAALSQRWPWRETDHLRSKLTSLELLDPVRAPRLIAQRVLDSNAHPRDVLRDIGLGTPGRRFGGLAEAAFRQACNKVMHSKGQDAVDGQRVLINWASDDAGKFGYQRVWPEFVEASLLPWEVNEPSEAHKSALLQMLESFGGGDPRARPQRWRTVMDKAPSSYAVLMRWLTRASVLQFLDIVDRLMPDPAAKLMWDYRRAFWMSYLLSDGSGPGIDAAWVAFGDEGARLANRAARESGDRSFAAFGKQNDKSPQHAALILQMGDLTIVDWSHSAKYQVWKRSDRGSPELFKSLYGRGALYSAPLQESHVSPSSYSWQKRLAQIIEGKAFFSPKPAWKPRRA